MAVLLSAAIVSPAQHKHQFRFIVTPGARLSLSNESGQVTVDSASGNEVTVTATRHSPGVQVDAQQPAPDRVVVNTHYLKRPPAADSAVDYAVTVPPDASVSLITSSGPVRVQNVQGAIEVSTETGAVDITHAGKGAVIVRSIAAPVVLANIAGARVRVMAVSGGVTLRDVSGPAVTVTTTAAPIRFSGNVAADSACELSTHSADIHVSLPASASVDVTASSLRGSVDDAFHLQPDAHPSLTVVTGKSFAGHANSGNASLTLRSFSGRITFSRQ